MKWLLVLAALTLLGCSPCKTSSDCGPGEHCEFTNGDCIKGCETAQDCSPRARCDVPSGKCVPRGSFDTPDAGTVTSTQSDAGS